MRHEHRIIDLLTKMTKYLCEPLFRQRYHDTYMFHCSEVSEQELLLHHQQLQGKQRKYV